MSSTHVDHVEMRAYAESIMKLPKAFNWLEYELARAYLELLNHKQRQDDRRDSDRHPPMLL